jgi:hypothetical protein
MASPTWEKNLKGFYIPMTLMWLQIPAVAAAQYEARVKFQRKDRKTDVHWT